MARGYQIIDPGLALPGLRLNDDAQVRCLSLLMGRIGEMVAVPEGVLFELIPVQYLGGPYPAIGLYTETSVDTAANLCRLSFVIEDRLAAYIQEIGLEQLIELSSHDPVQWQDILGPHEEALRRVRFQGQ